MGREVRRVPENWDHPRDSGGCFIPLHSGCVEELQARWDAREADWKRGLREDFFDASKLVPHGKVYEFSEWDGPRPLAEDYMPQWSDLEATHLMMYETCSEGTPISPAFATPEELARFLADSGASAFGGMTASYEHWLRTLEPTEADCARCGEEHSADELEDVDDKMICHECARECWVCGGDEPVVARAWVTTEGAPETAHCRDLCAACLTEERTEGRIVKVESYLDAAIKESQAALAAQTAALLSLQVTT